MPDSNVTDLLRTAQAFQRAKRQGLSYCYVRYQGGLIKPATRKFFYTDRTTLEAFIKHARESGIVKAVDFPETITYPLDEEELAVAWAEGRVVL